MRSLKVNEIFYSLQGEGFNTGTACVFVRFSGCNLRCSFCDTNHTDGTMMSIDEIVAEVMQYPQAPLIVLTGGEPSLQIDADFVDILKKRTGKRIAIETNGTRRLPDGIDWVTLSPKTGFDGGDMQQVVLQHCNELKVVYVGQDLSIYDQIDADNRFLQPCYVPSDAERETNIQACVQAVMQHPEWRLSLQTHRILNIR